MDCWICGAEGTTREHIVKASDLRSFFGHFSQKSPLYFHTKGKKNIPVGSYRSDRFKSKAKICNTCNSDTTQPYDEAWEQLSAYLRENFSQLRQNDRIDLSKVFPGSTRKSLLHVHLYFVKLFGCLIVEHHIPIDVSPFAAALRTRTAHRNIYLAFGPSLKHPKRKFAGVTPIEAVDENGVSVFATWFYILGDVVVDIIYSAEERYMKVVRDYWHPSRPGKIIRVSHFKHNHQLQAMLRDEPAQRA